MVWRLLREEFEPNCTVLTVKHDGDLVMIWGCFTQRAVGKLYILNRIMAKLCYRDTLEKNLLPSMEQFSLEQQCIFMHDSDPKHTFKLIKDWLKEKRIKTLVLPSYPLDFNLIENLCDELKRRVKKHQPKNKQKLESLLTGEWYFKSL